MNAHRPPLVLVHGWASDPRVWAAIETALAERFCLFPVALPGYAADGASVPEDVEAVGEWLRTRTPPGASWLAWSMGALPALYLSMGEDAHVGTLNLVAPVIRFEQGEDWPCGAPSGILRGFRIALRRDADALLERFARMVLEPDDEHSNAGNSKVRKSNVGKSNVGKSNVGSGQNPPGARDLDPRALEAGLTLLERADLRDRLADIVRPVTLFHGDRDAVVSPDSSRFALAALPDARLSLFEGAGHAPFVTHPQLFLQKFLADGRF